MKYFKYIILILLLLASPVFAKGSGHSSKGAVKAAVSKTNSKAHAPKKAQSSKGKKISFNGKQGKF